jgi:outer membrane protein assembly factor BamD (BamD/ComL family)
MAESDEAANSTLPYDEHGLYQVAMEKLAEGDEAGAATNLRMLAGLFPEEQAIQDLLVRLSLKSTFAEDKPVPVDHGQPRTLLRLAVLSALAMTVCLIGIVAFVAAYRHFVGTTIETAQQEAHIESLRQEGQQQMLAAEWNGAQKTYEGLLRLVPGDPTAQAAFPLIEEGKARDQMYDDAISAQEAGDLQRALDLFYQIREQGKHYSDINNRIEILQKQLELDAAWENVQSLVQAEDWQGAIPALAELRRDAPDFRSQEVKELLYGAYLQVARQLVAGARGDVEQVHQARQYMAEALMLDPANDELVDEHFLALKYGKGSDAAAQSEWVTAVVHWEAAHALRRDYQDGVLERRLYEAYPLAARQLIDQAKGDPDALRQAIGYLDKALTKRPGDAALERERQMASEFLAGAEAFAGQYWNHAITHWGPIYAVEPDYQDGLLEDGLLQACANSETPDETLCPP